jgi:hypothetical protein
MDIKITGVVEIRLDGKWICDNTLSKVRSGPGWDAVYWPRCLMLDAQRFFDLECRGLPDDVSETGRYMAEVYRGSGWKHSWLPLFEAARLCLEIEKDPLARAAASEDPCQYYFHESSDDAANYRFVYWFNYNSPVSPGNPKE